MTGLKQDARKRAHTIIEQLVEYRHRKGLTITDVAIKMGVAPNTVRRFEQSHSDPTITMFLLYAAACGNDVAVDFGERIDREHE